MAEVERLRTGNGKYVDTYEFFKMAVTAKASDIHIRTSLPPYLRVNGEEKPLNYMPVTVEGLRQIVKDILPSESEVELFENKETDGSITIQGHRFRINASQMYDDKQDRNQGYQLTARILDDTIRDIRNLGIPETCWKELTTLNRGLALVTGVTGSGKSSTLASLVQEINNNQKKCILTFEQPVEYIFNPVKSYIMQSEVPFSVRSFAGGIRRAMRQAPDIIIIGEMRDAETIEAALEAANTGHMVYATLHTKNAAETVSRIIGKFPTNQHSQIRYDLASNLSYVLSQQLVPRIDGNGRILAIEIFRNSEDQGARTLIREGKEQTQLTSYIQSRGRDGNITMDKYLQNLYEAKLISAQVAIDKAHYPVELSKKILNFSIP